MCEKFPNIRITEGNAFALLLPLRTRTYVSSQPIDEDIDYTQLENIVFTFGGVEYEADVTDRGVQIILPDTLAVGTYNAILTAEYLGNEIRAAYESAVTIVPWSAQSSAEQYIVGSPIVMRSAYVLSGAMTDAELEALKEEYREKNAQLQQAIADAEAAKAEWEQKAADLDGVAQESTLTQGVQDIIAAMPSTDGLATESNATENKDEILAAITANAGIPTLTIPDSTAAQELAPNVLYIFENRTSELTITLGAAIVGRASEYHFFIICGTTAPTVNFPAGIIWNGGSVPTIAADKTYEVSILNNIAAYFEV